MHDSQLKVIQIPVLRDNYIYLVSDVMTGETAVVDPALSRPVLDALKEHSLKLSFIFNTHHHSDHVGGNLDLKAATGCMIIGPIGERDRIPGIDLAVSSGEKVTLGSNSCVVMDLGGHTLGHNGYYFENAGKLFCGDTLFSLGCGRLFEGTADQMWKSLSRIAELPAATEVYCAHEYTEANSRFALSVDPNNSALKLYSEQIAKLRLAQKPTVPFNLGTQLAANPFLRAGSAHRFAELRLAKDRF